MANVILDSIAVTEGDEVTENKIGQEITDTLECKEEMETLVKLAKKNKPKRHTEDSLLISGQSLHDKSNSSNSSGSKNTS